MALVWKIVSKPSSVAFLMIGKLYIIKMAALVSEGALSSPSLVESKQQVDFCHTSCVIRTHLPPDVEIQCTDHSPLASTFSSLRSIE